MTSRDEAPAAASAESPAPAGPAGGFEARWREHYDWRARTFASEARAAAYSDAGFAARMQTLLALLAQLRLPRSPRTLDVGCASGAYVRVLERAGHRAVGLDYALAHLVRARAAPGGGAYVAGEAYALPFADGAFDLVVCMGVLQLVARPAALIAEAARVLGPGGVLIVEALNGAAITARALHLGDDLRRRALRHALHRPASVRRCLAEAGFPAVRSCGVYVVPAPAAGLQRWLGRLGITAAVDRLPALADRLAGAMFYVAAKRHPG